MELMTMKNRGLTLVELVVAMTIGGIILLALTCQFVAEQTFRIMINNQVAATNDASIAMRHMARILRYAKQSTIRLNDVDDLRLGYVTTIRATIDRFVANGVVANSNLPEFGDYIPGEDNTIICEVIYGRKADNTFEYRLERWTKATGETDYVTSNISNHITDFPVASLWWTEPDKSYKILTIQLTAQHGSESSSLESKIRVLGR